MYPLRRHKAKKFRGSKKSHNQFRISLQEKSEEKKFFLPLFTLTASIASAT